MRLMKAIAIGAGLLVAVASASPALARDGHGWKHHKRGHHHHHHYYDPFGPPVRYLRAPVVVERPVIYRAVPDYDYYGPPARPSLNINIPLR